MEVDDFLSPTCREMCGSRVAVLTKCMKDSGRESEGGAGAESPRLGYQGCLPPCSIPNLLPGRLLSCVQGSWGYETEPWPAPALTAAGQDTFPLSLHFFICNSEIIILTLELKLQAPTTALLSLLIFLLPLEQFLSSHSTPPRSSGSSLCLHCLLAPGLTHKHLPTCQSPHPCHHPATYFSVFPTRL